MSSEVLKHFVLLGAIVSWVFGYMLYQRTKHTNAHSMSTSAVSSKKAFLTFVAGISLSQVLQIVGVYGYLRPETSVPDLFYIFYAIVVALLVALALTPATKGLSYTIHYWSAWVMSYLLLTLGGLLFVNGADNPGSVDASGLAIFVGILLTVGLAAIGTWRHQPGRKPKELLFGQQLYFICFQLLLLARIYL